MHDMVQWWNRESSRIGTNGDRNRKVHMTRFTALALTVLGFCACSAGQTAGVRSSAPETPGAPRVTTDAGPITGMRDADSGVLVFRGIPYAAPPVGDLRWRPPQRVESWAHVRLADRLGRNCMQHQPYGDIDPYAAGISEDCLYLNVWTTSLGGGRPVMVWIHGGGFWAGFGGEERHNGARLARKGAV